jgi:hypothetical protein
MLYYYRYGRLASDKWYLWVQCIYALVFGILLEEPRQSSSAGKIAGYHEHNGSIAPRAALASIQFTSGEALVVSFIWEGSPDPYRFQVGDEIVGFNGVPGEEWIPRLTTAPGTQTSLGTATSRSVIG